VGLFSWIWGNKEDSSGIQTELNREKIEERWHWVEDQLILGKPNNLKLAIIEADKIVDEVLKVSYPKEKTMADRMKKAVDKFRNRQTYQDLWYCHKVRNIIAHEASYDLPTFEAKNVLEKYRVALDELGVL
jgi:hypothetical protein